MGDEIAAVIFCVTIYSWLYVAVILYPPEGCFYRSIQITFYSSKSFTSLFAASTNFLISLSDSEKAK